MNVIDRSTLSDLNAAARRARAEHVHALFAALAGRVRRLFATNPVPRPARWA